MFLLNKFQKRRHVRPTEMVDGLQSGKYTRLR